MRHRSVLGLLHHFGLDSSYPLIIIMLIIIIVFHFLRQHYSNFNNLNLYHNSHLQSTSSNNDIYFSIPVIKKSHRLFVANNSINHFPSSSFILLFNSSVSTSPFILQKKEKKRKPKKKKFPSSYIRFFPSYNIS